MRRQHDRCLELVLTLITALANESKCTATGRTPGNQSEVKALLSVTGTELSQLAIEFQFKYCNRS